MQDDWKSVLQEWEKLLRKQANAESALGMSAYMKNNFPFLGIKKPSRELMGKPFISELKSLDSEIIEHVLINLWEQDEREFQYNAIDLLKRANYLKISHFPELAIRLIKSKSWWDTVDLLASGPLGKWYLKGRKDQLLFDAIAWSRDENGWVNRTAILVQLKFRNETNKTLLADVIRPHIASKWFFHQKAIGWALREFAKTDPEWVLDFVDSFKLKGLSRREALKHF